MIIKIDDWTLFSCKTSMEADNKIEQLLKICDSDEGQPIHIYLTHSTGLSDDLHVIMNYFRRNKVAQKYEYTITTTIKNDRPRVVLNIRWVQNAN